MNDLARAGSLVIAVALAAGACSTGTRSAVPNTTSASSSSSPLATSTSTSAAPSGSTTATSAADVDALARLLITAVPAGYVQQDDSVGDTGPSDLAKAAADDGSSDAQAVLTTEGFVHGYQRLWQTTDQHQIVVFLYQFETPAGASSYGSRVVAGEQADTAMGGTIFAVPGVPNATGITFSGGGNYIAHAIFFKGPYLVQVLVDGPSTTDTQTLSQQLAADQFTRL